MQTINTRDVLLSKTGAGIELLLFLVILFSPLPIFVSATLLIGIAVASLIIRQTEWKDIGFTWRDFSSWKIFLGIATAVIYTLISQFLVNPVADKIAPPGLPEIFDMEGNFFKLIAGLLLSWTSAAFFEELLFRGYLISRLIDLMGETTYTRIAIILISGFVFGFVHLYQGLNGALHAGVIGMFQAIVFFTDGKKLTIPIVTHGVFDTIGFTWLFLG